MIPRKYFDNAAAITAKLIARQQELGLTDADLGRITGTARSCIGKWRHVERQPFLRSTMAIADALGMEIVLRERQP